MFEKKGRLKSSFLNLMLTVELKGAKLQIVFKGANMDRKMASIQKIAEVKPIPDADKISAYRVGGWWIVDSIEKYVQGDHIIYCEVDSWIPHERAPFLSKGKEPREYNGVRGERLRTVKLRGQVSQGLLIPMSALTNYGADLSEGDDVSDELGIIKWEAPIPAQLAGEVEGVFPSFIPKTDQERIQNLTTQFQIWKNVDIDWEVTEKLDGSSMTVFVNNDESGVCSRNLWLKESDTNTFCKVAARETLIDKIKSTGRNLALQGELCGEGIQGNPYKLFGQQFFLYDIFDIDVQDYLSPADRQTLSRDLNIQHVPLIDSNRKFTNFNTVDDILTDCDGNSIFVGAIREGFVYKCNQQSMSFKSISNTFLLGSKE